MLRSQMPTVSPRVSFILLMLVSGLVLLGGVFLSKRDERHVISRDREPVKSFATELQKEIEKLEYLYDSHLRRIAREQERSDETTIRRVCESIAGVEQLSVIHPGTLASTDVHIPIRFGSRLPRPSVRSPGADLAGWSTVLPQEVVFDLTGDSWGWIDEPGKSLMFWVRRSATEAVVFLINRTEVIGAMNGWIASWAKTSVGTLGKSGGTDHLIGADNVLLVSSNPSLIPDKERADFLLPLRGRFGTWQLASWDEWQVRSSYSTPVLVATTGLAVLIAACAVVLSAQQRQALRLAEQRVSFVNRVSHELRAPLTNILLNLDLAAEGFQDSPERGERKLAIVQEEARRLGRLIENVLTFSRGQHDRISTRLRATEPDAVVAATLHQFTPLFARRGIPTHIACNAPGSYLIDPDALAQILSNLLSNVEKYAPGDPVEIRTDWRNGHLHINVVDSGPGIPAHDAERIFRPFERLSFRTNEGSTGSGLGLAIARELAFSMGGNLRLVPASRGAHFEVRIPAPAAPRLVSVA